MRKKLAKVASVIMAVSLIVSGVGQEAEAAKNVKLNKKSVKIQVGKSVKLKVKNKAKKAKVAWKSKNKKIATVSKKGKVKGRKAGNTKIICTVKKGKKKVKLTCKVKVFKKKKQKPAQSTTPIVTEMPHNQVSSETPSETPKTIIPEQSAQPTPTIKPGEDYHINWPSQYTDDYLPLHELATSFKVGSAIAGSKEELSALYDPDMVGILQKHYNTTTLTNLMKPTYLLDQEGSQASADGMPAVSFESCDKALKFCQDTGIQMRGHVLVWYNQTPSWFFYEDYDTEKELVDKATIQARMESYIKQVVTYVQTNYPGVVYCWDVVNEAVEDDGTIRKNNNLWYTVYAEGKEDYSEYEYVKDAFTYAKKYASSDVKLVYNDYNTFKPDKRAGILSMIEYVNKEQKLIDTMGMQCPILQEWPYIKANENVNRDEDACVEYAIEDFSAAGLELMMTELCVRTHGGNTKEEIETQAQRYKEMYQLLMAMDMENGGQAQITSVTTFGISDSYRLYSDDSWAPGDESRYAWFFDKNCKAKLAFKCVYNVFATEKGKPTVEETYEAPEESETNQDTHLVTGKVLMKNGNPMVNQTIIFWGKNDKNSASANTDAEGNYSVQMASDTYEIYVPEIGPIGNFVVPVTDEATINKDIQLTTNFYRVNGVVKSKNGRVYANRSLRFKVTCPDLEMTESEYIYTDSKGEFTKYLREGTYKGQSGSAEKLEFDINAEYSKTNPLVITLLSDLYQVSGRVNFLNDSIGEIYLRFENMERTESYPILIAEDGSYSVNLPENTYIAVGSQYLFDEETEDESQSSFYFGKVTVSDDILYDFEENSLHRVTIETQNVDGAVEFENVIINDTFSMWIYGDGQMYIGNDTGSIEGAYREVNQKGEVYGIYSFEATFALTESDGDFVIRDGIKQLDEAIKLDEEHSFTLKEELNKYGYVYDTHYLSFIPEESGTYTFYSKYDMAEEDKDKYAEFEMSLHDNTMKYIDECYVELGNQFNYDMELEAGKKYFIYCSVYQEDELLTNKNFPVGIKKADSQNN